MSPSNWSRTKLGDLLNAVSRLQPVTKDREYSLLGVRWYGNGAHLHATMAGANIKTPTLNEVREGDITYNKMWVTKGAFAVVAKECTGLFSTSEYPLFETTPRVDSAFLRWIFASPLFIEAATNAARGTTSRKRLNPGDFLKLSVHVPLVPEQRKIAAILSSVDDAIEATQVVIGQLQVVKKAMMAELLTRGLPGRHTRYKQTEIGEVPDNWDVLELSEMASVVRGSSPRPARDPRFFGGSTVPWITVGELSKDDWPLLTSTTTHLTAEGKERSRFLERGTVVLSNSGFGCGVPKILDLDGCANDGIAAFLKLRRIRPLFLYYVLASMTEHLRGSVARGVDQPNLNTTIIGEIHVACPDAAEQDAITKILFAIDERLHDERSYLKALGGSKSALISVLLTGEVRVTPGADL